MGLFRKKPEIRADDPVLGTEDWLLKALVGSMEISKEQALAIPSVSGCLNYISGVVSSLPIKLYEKVDGKIKEITDDPRLKLLNDDTKDQLTAVQFWRAVLEDYYLGKGGYAYKNRQGNTLKSIHYVDECHISIQKNADPIFKDYDIHVNGKPYYPFDFFKVLRKTKDGATSKSLIDENALIFAVAYWSLKFEDRLVRKGGNKKGFLESSKKLTNEAITALKEAWRNFYANNDETAIILNEGITFHESSNTSVEMQLNENKLTNSSEISMLFTIPNAIIRGNATEQDHKNAIRGCITPLLNDIECSLDRDLLLEREKDTRYFAFDTKELTRGNIKERYEAYEIALRNNFLQVDEVRSEEDKDELGFNMIKLSLGDVFYNPATGDIITPNTGQSQNINVKGGEQDESGNQS